MMKTLSVFFSASLFFALMLSSNTKVLAFSSTQVKQDVDITFRVDMSNQTVSPNGVHIAGDFQNWNPGSTPMSPDGNNVYTYTHTFTTGQSIEYKFINGNDWSGAEQIPANCAQNGNRFLTIPDQNTILPAVCFGSCNPCGNPVMVTFLVDMSEENVSPNGVHVAGSFQGWNPSGTAMTDIGNMLYSVTVTISEGDYHEYKFINGMDWPGEEQVPADCGVSNGLGGFNRFMTVPVGGGSLNEVCFGSCYPCGFVPTEVQVTFRVDLSLETVSPNGVHITGAFQGWDPGANEMIHIGDDIYSATFTLWYGDHHQYKFINGNTWDDEEIVPAACGEDNGLGGYNRFIDVPEVDTTLATVCYSSCEPCGFIPNEVDVSFRVDMSKQSVSPNGVHLAGTFQGWDPGATPMTLVADEVYEATLTLSEGDLHHYKFINGNTWDGEEIVPEECGVDNGTGGYNRFFTVPGEGMVIPEVCFGSCAPCPPTGIDFNETINHPVLSPNPFGDQLTLRFNSTKEGMMTIKLVNIIGQESSVITAMEVQHGLFIRQVDVKHLPAGIYFARIELTTIDGVEVLTQKVVKY
jgi:hypothetical protein